MSAEEVLEPAEDQFSNYVTCFILVIIRRIELLAIRLHIKLCKLKRISEKVCNPVDFVLPSRSLLTQSAQEIRDPISCKGKCSRIKFKWHRNSFQLVSTSSTG